MSIATVTSKGQVTIPKDVRDALGIKQGDRLEFVVQEDGSLRVRPLKVDIRDLFGILETDRHVTVEEMNEAIARRCADEARRR
jgi:AbrB family looped-hinge helix DNA binding protein